MRVATIDIGTNSVLLLAAERGADGRFRPLVERMEITRLGRGVDRTGVLNEEALADTLAAVDTFGQEARALGCKEVVATATSAARDARNGSELVERAKRVGVAVEIISGEREAQLSYAAVASDFAPGQEELAVIDIGGGSTEFIVGRGRHVDSRRSVNVGSVRLTERHIEGDPPAPAALAAVDTGIRDALSLVKPAPPGARIVGIAGTFTTVAAIHLGIEPYDPDRVHGVEINTRDMSAVADRLASLTLAERRQIRGLSPKRADVIVAGARLAVASVRALGRESVTIGDRGVRWGYLYDRFGASDSPK
jgi:exopolyphosphatase/guanosine-5'-triphosphate,3'-diphosphate pyrophosphatase